MGKVHKTFKIIVRVLPPQEHNFLNIYLFSLVYYFLWALDNLLFSDTVALFNMETKAKVNLWRLMAILKTLRLEFSKTTTALDLFQEHLS